MVIRNSMFTLALIGAIPLCSAGVKAADADGPAAPTCVLGGTALAGMVVHIDPATGRPTSHPLPEHAAEMAKLESARANRSTEGLVEEVGPTGGVRVNLRNRFRSPLVAVVADDGTVMSDHFSCRPTPAAIDAGGESRTGPHA